MSYRAISPLDGRYAPQSKALSAYLSEWALMKYRVDVELRWLVAMSDHDAITHVRSLTIEERGLIQSIVDEFDDGDMEAIKAIEADINHDVKAVEVFLQERLQRASLADLTASLHFACTSDDINNLAYAMMFRDAMRMVWLPRADSLIRQLQTLAGVTAEAAMIGRTHGQAATPTTMGKELKVFEFRLRRQLRQIEEQEYLGKFNGAVGAYNAHWVAYPELDWLAISREFVEGLGLAHNPLTTQIEPHDFLAELAHKLIRFNTILLDCCRDIWTYIALRYFKQKHQAAEVGSSTMPHKVNPIDFENAEANLGVSNALFAHLAEKLPVSRLQRDLSDSSALRNFGVAITYSFLALQMMERGLGKISLDERALAADLDDAWEVLGEAVQTILRKHHDPGAYPRLKALTRGQTVSRETIRNYVSSLSIPPEDKDRLLQLTPTTYMGLATVLARLEYDDV